MTLIGVMPDDDHNGAGIIDSRGGVKFFDKDSDSPLVPVYDGSIPYPRRTKF